MPERFPVPHIMQFLARNNMAKFTTPVVHDGIPFTDSEDLVAYVQSKAKAGAAPARPSAPAPIPPRPYAPAPTPVRPYAPAPTPAGGGLSDQTRADLQALLGGAGGGGGYSPTPVSSSSGGYAPGRALDADLLSAESVSGAISSALGGINNYCPGRKPDPTPEQKYRLGNYISGGFGRDGFTTKALREMAAAGDSLAEEALQFRVTAFDVLQEMGLTPNAMQELAKELRRENLLQVVEFEITAKNAFTKEKFPTGKYQRYLAVANYPDHRGKMVEVTNKATVQVHPEMVARARAIAEKYGLSCRIKPNPYFSGHGGLPRRNRF